jgi:hypothetical protein
MSPVLMQLPSPPRTPPIQAEVIPTVASCTVEYLADESKKAELIESILRWTAQRHEGYRVYITAENADDRQGPTPNGLPVREEACLGPVNAGRIGLMRVFLDLTANHQEELQKNGRENVGRWMVTLRNKVVPGYRDTLLRQVVVKGYQFVPMMMCVPTFDTPDETAPVHMVFALGQPQRIAGVSSAVHLVMKSSVFKKSFFADWIRDVQENPDYEYDKSEEQTFVGQNLIVSATEFNRVDQRVAKLLSDRIASLAGEPSSDSYGGATAEVAANRMMHDEYLKAEWTDLIDSLTRMRDLLSSGFEFSANK